MKLALKIGLEVDKETEVVLDGQSKILNWLYNHLLEKANKMRKEYVEKQSQEVAKILYSERGLRDLVPAIKPQFPFLKTLYSSPVKNAALRLSQAIKSYQDGKKGRRKNQVNWPKYRSWKKRWFSLQYDEPWKGYELEAKSLKLQLGVGSEGKRLSINLELRETLSVEVKRVKQLRIVKEAGSFFAIFTIEKEVVEQREIKNLSSPLPIKIIALDPNHKNLVYGVGNDAKALEIENFPEIKKIEKRIDYLKGRRDKCNKYSRLVEYRREDSTIHKHYEPSRQWKYFNKQLEKAYILRREQTKTYLYTIANQLCKNYLVIGCGDYCPRGGAITTPMRRSMNNESLIGRFKEILAWVATRSGKLYLEYEEKGTTRTCHVCNYVVKEGIPVKLREWICPNCTTFHIRDENAAQNGLFLILDKLFLPRSGRVPVTIQGRWTWKVLPSGVKSLRGQGSFSQQKQLPRD